jgi:hypothetical protein
MLDTLDAIIATAAVALGLSLIVQAIQQIIKQWLDLKSNYMRFQLLAMFNSSQSISSSPAQTGLRRITKMVGEVDGNARKIVDQLESATKSFGYKDLELIEAISVDDMKRLTKSLPMFAKAKEEWKNVEKDIETWLAFTQRAFQELYQRRMKLWSFIVSAIVVVMLNANLIEVYGEFSTNKVVRDAAVAMADKFVAMPRDSILVKDKTGIKDTAYVVSKPDSLIVKQIQKSLSDVQQIAASKTFQVFRWTKASVAQFYGARWYVIWPTALLGWLAMTLLVSLGAPFWYDLLKTLMGIKDYLKKQGGENDK